ncbi:MAG: hypothetical protein AVDCRST_MAG30-1448 [uncultured Solirubrobacteraceae bacterium]|uniref:NodB homology domain-containing protein n=1 Tax=uncultured Solirubrobacteraceae bacterium TaxID=1162706 RepID=A0A6J4SF92_9ACTN|nr:MAG: hypothetical protein AVDCRST_MAG30-1448 [uncultured Solirubrobacteraceae bacterium]
MSAAVLAGRALDAARRRQPPFALNYHGVGERVSADPHGLVVGLDVFERHLAGLRAQGRRLVGMTDLWRRVRAGGDAAQGQGAVTIDDGLSRTLEGVLPVLERHGATATAYIPTGLIGGPHPHLPEARIADRAQLLEVAAAGVEIGAHSVTHPRLSELPYPQALDEVRRSRADLEDLLGRAVTSMAYPFGRYTAETQRAAEAAGYECACADVGSGPWRRFALPREGILPSTSPLRLRLKVMGLYEPALRLAQARNALRAR